MNHLSLFTSYFNSRTDCAVFSSCLQSCRTLEQWRHFSPSTPIYAVVPGKNRETGKSKSYFDGLC